MSMVHYDAKEYLTCLRPYWLKCRSALMALVMLSSISSCTVIVEGRSSKCSSNDDCTARGAGFERTVCDTARGVCMLPAEPTGGCATNAECTQSKGEASICRKSDRRCVTLKSPECPRLLADSSDLADDNTVYVGTILARTGVTEPAALAIEDAMDLARMEFKTASPGLPPLTPNGPQRPLALVACDEANDVVKAAQHLRELEVPAIIGAYYSRSTINVAKLETIVNNILLVTPASNSPLITTLQTSNPRMVWRMVPSDAIQAVVVPEVVKTVLEPQVREELRQGDASKPAMLKVAVVFRGDAAGLGISGNMIPKLQFNGKAALENGENFLQLDYGDPLDKVNNPDPEAKMALAADRLTQFQPNIVITVGVTSEVITKIFAPVEAQWTQSAYRVHYLLANNTLQSRETLAFIGGNADLRHRVIGTAAGASGAAVEYLKGRYASHTKVPYTGLVPFGYDSVYLVALGIAATGSQPLTGPNIAVSFNRLLPPADTRIDANLANISQAYTILAAGGKFDFNGVSGPLDFDPDTGDAESDVQVWCAGVDESGNAKDFRNSGLFYSAQSHGLQGKLDCPQ